MANLAWSASFGLISGGFVYVGFGLRPRDPLFRFLSVIGGVSLSVVVLSYLWQGDNLPGDRTTPSTMIPAQVLVVVAWVFAFRHRKRRVVARPKIPFDPVSYAICTGAIPVWNWMLVRLAYQMRTDAYPRRIRALPLLDPERI